MATGLQKYTVQEATNLISQRKVIRVTPTLTVGSPTAFGAGDVFFNSTEIPNAVPIEGGASSLENVSYVFHDDDNSVDFDLIFHQVDAEDLGTVNSGPDISKSNLQAAKILGVWTVDGTDNDSDLGGAMVGSVGHVSEGNGGTNRIYLQAETASTSVYVSCIIKSTPTLAAAATDHLELIFNINY